MSKTPRPRATGEGGTTGAGNRVPAAPGERRKKSLAPQPPTSSTSTGIPTNSFKSTAPNIPRTTTKQKIANQLVRTLIPPEESTAQHHELFLQEIEAVDEYWGPTFRGVYESGEHALFLERLEERIKRHDRDIELDTISLFYSPIYFHC